MKIADLKPGMLIKDVGLITAVDSTSDSKFWQSPNIHFIEGEDPYWGVLGRSTKEGEDFEVLYRPDDTGYETTLRKIMDGLEERRSNAMKDIKIVRRYLK